MATKTVKNKKIWYGLADNAYCNMGECLSGETLIEAHQEYTDCKDASEDDIFVYKIELVGKLKKTFEIIPL